MARGREQPPRLIQILRMVQRKAELDEPRFGLRIERKRFLAQIEEPPGFDRAPQIDSGVIGETEFILIILAMLVNRKSLQIVYSFRVAATSRAWRVFAGQRQLARWPRIGYNAGVIRWLGQKGAGR